jgi:hypothetical protein
MVKPVEAPQVDLKATKLSIRYFDWGTLEPVEGPEEVILYEFERGLNAVIKPKQFKRERHRFDYELEIREQMQVGVHWGGLSAAILLTPGEELFIDLPVRAVKPEAQNATITVHIEEATRKGEEQGKAIKHATVSAKPFATITEGGVKRLSDSEEAAISAEIKEGMAVLEVKSGYLYEVGVKTLGPYAGSRPQLPVFVPLPSAKKVDLRIALEPCKRTLTLLFVDSCGQRMKGTSCFVGSKKFTADEKGACEIEIGSLGTLQVWSPEYDFSPSEIPVGESLAQAIVITVAKPGLGEVVINLLDDSGKPLDQSKVYVRSKKTGEMHEGITDVKGQFRLPVPKGQYEVFAEPPSPDFDIPIQVINV